MNHLEKERIYSSPSLILDDNDRGAGDVRGGVGPRTTHFYSQNVTFVRDSQYGGGGVSSYQHEHTLY